MTPAPGKKPCCDWAKTAAYVLGIAGALLFMAYLVWVMYRYNRPEEDGTAARPAERRQALRDMRAADQQSLTSYGWVNKEREIARIPVERAMEMTLRLWQNPQAARSDLVARAERAYPAPPAGEGEAGQDQEQDSAAQGGQQ